jgi:hypothetical protein
MLREPLRCAWLCALLPRGSAIEVDLLCALGAKSQTLEGHTVLYYGTDLA